MIFWKKCANSILILEVYYVKRKFRKRHRLVQKELKRPAKLKIPKKKRQKKYMYLTDYSENVQAAMKLYV